MAMSDDQLREWAETQNLDLHARAADLLGDASVSVLSDDEWARLEAMVTSAKITLEWK